MASIARLYDFMASTKGLPSQVNAEYNQILTFLNSQVAHVDGSKPYTGLPNLPASDPTLDNEMTRKKYADDAVSLSSFRYWLTNGSSGNLTSTTYVGWGVPQFTFAKRLGSGVTNLICEYFITGWVSLQGGLYEAAVRVDGVDTQVARLYYNTLNKHKAVEGVVELAGLASGDRTIVTTAKVQAGIQFNVDANDMFGLRIREVRI